jgi:hypothetical protein
MFEKRSCHKECLDSCVMIHAPSSEAAVLRRSRPVHRKRAASVFCMEDASPNQRKAEAAEIYDFSPGLHSRWQSWSCCERPTRMGSSSAGIMINGGET